MRAPRDSFEAVAANRNSFSRHDGPGPQMQTPGGTHHHRCGAGFLVADLSSDNTRCLSEHVRQKRHANIQGGEMSQSTTTSAITREVVHTAAPTSEKDGTSAAPVLITEQEVLFSTRVALLLRKASNPPPVDRCDSGGRGLAAPAATAPALSDRHRLPRAVAHGPRNGPAVSTFQYDWSGSPRLDALLHELGASLRRDFDHSELSVAAEPSPNPEPPSRWRPSDV